MKRILSLLTVLALGVLAAPAAFAAAANPWVEFTKDQKMVNSYQDVPTTT